MARFTSGHFVSVALVLRSARADCSTREEREVLRCVALRLCGLFSLNSEFDDERFLMAAGTDERDWVVLGEVSS